MFDDDTVCLDLRQKEIFQIIKQAAPMKRRELSEILIREKIMSPPAQKMSEEERLRVDQDTYMVRALMSGVITQQQWEEYKRKQQEELQKIEKDNVLKQEQEPLVERFPVSHSTIQKDLAYMEKAGLIKRDRGYIYLSENCDENLGCKYNSEDLE